jgi:hypothetical protein
MFGGGGARAPTPPPLPPPPPNPPTQTFTPPSTAGTPQGLFAGNILTSPLGAPAANATQRKSLFGQ